MTVASTGIGMLSKEKPLSSRYLPLPGREEARALLVVEFEKYIYCCTHLSLTEEDRMLSLPIIREVATKAQKPLFIARRLERASGVAVPSGFATGFCVIDQSEATYFPCR